MGGSNDRRTFLESIYEWSPGFFKTAYQTFVKKKKLPFCNKLVVISLSIFLLGITFLTLKVGIDGFRPKVEFIIAIITGSHVLIFLPIATLFVILAGIMDFVEDGKFLLKTSDIRASLLANVLKISVGVIAAYVFYILFLKNSLVDPLVLIGLFLSVTGFFLLSLSLLASGFIGLRQEVGRFRRKEY